MLAAARSGIRKNSGISIPGPLAYYSLGEASGTTMVDGSGNGRDGTYHGGVTLGTAGLSTVGGTCATFDGTSGYGEASSSGFDTPNLTLEAIIKTSSSGSIRSILDRDSGGISSLRVWQFRKNAANKLEFILIGGSVTTVTGTTSINDGLPHHVAATYDGATIRIYVNGVQDGSAACTTALNLTSGSPFRVGVNSSSGLNAYWSGQIDEVRYYSSALSAAQVLARKQQLLG